ncbi:MAG: hypothetical protein ACYDCO_08985 [Armatimonadota bacterium]
MQTSDDVLTLHFFTWLSVACILAYLFFRGHRSYLLYLGAAFMCVTLLLLTEGTLRWVMAGITLLALVMAFVEGTSDVKERLQKLREEQKEREMAFAEFQRALVDREMREEGKKPSGAEPRA